MRLRNLGAPSALVFANLLHLSHARLQDMRDGCADIIEFKKVYDVDSQKRDEFGQPLIKSPPYSDDYSDTSMYKRKPTKKVKTIYFSKNPRKSRRRGRNKKVKAILTQAYTAATTASTVTSFTEDATTTTEQPGTLPEPKTYPSNEETHVILLMDETGSMQPNRQKMIDSYNEEIIGSRKLWTDNGKKAVTYTYVSFNTKMKIHDWGNVENAKKLDRASYNPGYNTRLYDAVGCIAEKYGHENDVIFYVWSDGKDHSRERIYEASDVADVIQKIRQKNWKLYFMGCGKNPNENEGIKESVKAMGFYDNELTLVDGRDDSAVGESLKSVKSNLRHELIGGDLFDIGSRMRARKPRRGGRNKRLG